MEMRMRTIQPAHKSENITVEEAIRAWKKIFAEDAARKTRRRKGAAKPLARRPSSGAANVAADHDARTDQP